MTAKPLSSGALRHTRRLAMVLLIGMPFPLAACELDGLSHGYGPMSALFAGAHRYQSLNGLEDEESPPEPPPAPADSAAADGGRPSSSVTTAPPPSPPTTPPRSFVAWAKAKPKPAEATLAADDSPPAWLKRPVQHGESSSAAGEARETQER